MDFLPQDLLNSFDVYTQMQGEHLKALKAPEPDIETMNFERSRNFAELEQQLRSLLRQMQTPAFSDEVRADMAQACNRRIQTLLDRDAIITEGIRQHKTTLSRQMQELKKGKTAVNGYGAATQGRALVRLSG